VNRELGLARTMRRFAAVRVRYNALQPPARFTSCTGDVDATEKKGVLLGFAMSLIAADLTSFTFAQELQSTAATSRLTLSL